MDRRDPQEYDPKIRPYIEVAALEAEKELEARGTPHELGYCHMLWATQKRILKERWNIDWRSPAEMNPDVLFD